jgi:hypothetical protein
LIEFAKRNWLFLLPLVVFAGYYGIQNVLGFLFYPYDIPLTFLVALASSVGSYVLAYECLPTEWVGIIKVRRGAPNLELFCLIVVALFTFVVVAACATSDHIPILEALSGSNASDLAGYRNDFLRSRVGSGQILNYGFAILSQSMMPLALTYAYWSRAKWRHLALFIFILGASITLSKAAMLLVTAPLIALFVMQCRWRYAAATLVCFIASIAIMYVLASGIVGSWQSKAVGEPVSEHQVEMPSDVPAQYNAFASKNPVLLVANRIVWIPYATAIDWFRYQKEVLGRKYVLGQSIGPVAFLMGEKRVQLEREVANFEWGGDSGNTSNAVFFADAWLNWGLVGVILYSALFAFTIKIITRTGYPPLMAASVMPIWIACFSPLPPVYFSAGLGFLLIAAVLIRNKKALELDRSTVHATERACAAGAGR